MGYKLNLHVFPEFRHLTSDGSSNVIFDSNTCHLFEVDEMGLDILLRLSQGEDPANVGRLLERDYGLEVVEQGVNQAVEAITAGVIGQRSDCGVYGPNKGELSFVVLNVSHDCQLACEYCFAGGGNYGIQDRRAMTLEVAKAAIQLVNSRRGRKPANISFFGGEPLLNWDIIVESIEYATSVCRGETGEPEVTFGITTNGIGLTKKKAEYLKKHNVSMMISIDGDKKTHNTLRPCKDTSLDSWELTMAGAKNTMEAGLQPTARATISALNTDLCELADVFRAIGFKRLNMQPVESDPSHELAISHKHLLAYEASLTELMEYGHDMCYELRTLYPSIANASKGHLMCGMGITGIAVAPDGSIYPCHRLVGQDAFYVGNVLEGFNESRSSSWLENHSVDKSVQCHMCHMRYICRGGCYAENYFTTGRISTPYSFKCHIMKHGFLRAVERILLERKNALT